MKHALRNAFDSIYNHCRFHPTLLIQRGDHHRKHFCLACMGRLYLLALGDYDYPVQCYLFLLAVLTVIAYIAETFYILSRSPHSFIIGKVKTYVCRPGRHSLG